MYRSRTRTSNLRAVGLGCELFPLQLRGYVKVTAFCIPMYLTALITALIYSMLQLMREHELQEAKPSRTSIDYH